MSNSSTTTIISFSLIALIIGLGIGFTISNSNSQLIIQTQETTITTQAQVINNSQLQITDFEDQIQNINATIQTKQNEIESLSEELNLLQENLDNQPDTIQAQQDAINDLKAEIQELKYEKILLKSRLGDRLEWEKYQNHGFSFEFPPEYDLSIIDNGYDNGEILSFNLIDPFIYFDYIWISTETLENAVSELEEEQDSKIELQNTIPTKINTHEASFYIYNITVGDGSYHGILCAWECSVTNRIHLLYQYSNKDPLTDFFKILSTVECHTHGENT